MLNDLDKVTESIEQTPWTHPLTFQSGALPAVTLGVKQEWQVINYLGNASMSHCHLEFLCWTLVVFVWSERGAMWSELVRRHPLKLCNDFPQMQGGSLHLSHLIWSHSLGVKTTGFELDRDRNPSSASYSCVTLSWLFNLAQCKSSDL